jgi:hypothetical protein
MEKDLKILKKILNSLHYSETYSDMLISHIIEKFNESNLESITPNFIYYSLIHDEGKETAKKISNFFKEIKETGEYNLIPKLKK